MLIMRGNPSRAAGVRAGAGRAALLAAAWLVAGAAAQSPPPAPAPEPTPPPTAAFEEEVSVAWILVPVTVRDRRGYVRGLDRRDFRLEVDGRPVAFADFEQRGEAPWSLVFLQDLSGSMGVGGRVESSQEAARYFLDRSREGDEVAIATFASGFTTVDVPFTEDLGVAREAVATWEGWGKTALHDAVARLPEISSSSRNVKRAAILITDGVDNASAVTPAAARELVRRAELPVYVLGLESGDPFMLDESGKKVYRYADVLNLLAAMTGGRYFSIGGPDDLKEACAAIAEDLRYQYVLGFDTSGGGRVADRSIRVTIKGESDLQVKSRRAYRGTAPAR
jgi:Ca-activated chloride channel family protein